MEVLYFMEPKSCSRSSVLLTLYDLLGVIQEELTERLSLGPLQSVQQLLDLSGNTAVHWHTWRAQR
jgi:hypothetical protein